MQTIVVALGGNALAPAGEAGTIVDQFAHTRESLAPVVDLASEGWRIAMVHGNGPQVGNALMQQQMARGVVPPLPLGVLVASTEGWIGYMIQQSLQNALDRAGVDRQVATLVTQVVVDPADPTLEHPTKPIGRAMDEEDARTLARAMHSDVTETSHGWRCVIASPRPLRIVEGPLIRSLVEAGHLVIAAGGGGTPVYYHPAMWLEGIDAVIDKDRAAALLASQIEAEMLLILTDVEGVYTKYGTDEQQFVRHLTASAAEMLLGTGELGVGSMAPKVEAAIQFIRAGGKRAVIARLDQGCQAVAGECGTEIVPD
jgi:carbamate kinase